MAAKKKVITNLSLADIQGQGLDEPISSPTVQVESWVQSPPRSKGEIISDVSAGITLLTQILSESKES
jgi:electron transfer flavoprotein alpha/beta subunit